MPEDHKQVRFKDDPDTKIVALTPAESGLHLHDLIIALQEIEESAKSPDRLTVIFEDTDASWTIQRVSYDKTWVRLG